MSFRQLPWHIPSLLLLLMGLASVLFLDTLAARQGEVPRFFQVLRPVQFTVAIAGLIILIVRSALS